MISQFGNTQSIFPFGKLYQCLNCIGSCPAKNHSVTLFLKKLPPILEMFSDLPKFSLFLVNNWSKKGKREGNSYKISLDISWGKVSK
ncbi:MAG: hypothetical protein C6I01_05385 [Epsilonproteobacteria bacterium]|nr:hypothetical protein [Campylobacterota bacterium]